MALQTDKQKLILAVPKGRILDQLMPIFGQIGLQPEAAFFDAADRRLRFATNCDDIDVIRVRSLMWPHFWLMAQLTWVWRAQTC